MRDMTLSMDKGSRRIILYHQFVCKLENLLVWNTVASCSENGNQGYLYFHDPLSYH